MPTNTMEAAISGSTIIAGRVMTPNVASASVKECAIVNEVMIRALLGTPPELVVEQRFPEPTAEAEAV